MKIIIPPLLLFRIYLSIDRFLRFTRSLHLSRSLPRFRQQRDLNRIPRLQQSSFSLTVHTVKLVPPRPVDGGRGNEIRSPKRDLQTRLIPITTILDPPSPTFFAHFSVASRWIPPDTVLPVNCVDEASEGTDETKGGEGSGKGG